jgi:Protein of Unknown function (DUF2784)
MPWLLLADSVVIIHLAFVLFVVAGGLLVLCWHRLAWLHLPAAAWGMLTEFLHIVCPLTYLEDRLRNLAGVAAYSGDFVTHYLLPILYPPNLTAQIQILLGIAVLIINVSIYAWLLRGRLFRRRH